jgi:hypothetical protein
LIAPDTKMMDTLALVSAKGPEESSVELTVYKPDSLMEIGGFYVLPLYLTIHAAMQFIVLNFTNLTGF